MLSIFKPKRKSGNGTTAKQDLYLLVCKQYPVLFKIGISKDATERAKDISREKVGTWVAVTVIRTEFAYQIEQFLLTATIFFYWPFFGGKEMRWGPLWLLLVPVYWLIFIIRYLIIMAFWFGLGYAFWWFHQ